MTVVVGMTTGRDRLRRVAMAVQMSSDLETAAEIDMDEVDVRGVDQGRLLTDADGLPAHVDRLHSTPKRNCLYPEDCQLMSQNVKS